MASYKIISADTHTYETPEVWGDRIAPEFKERAPRIVREEDGDWWYTEGRKTTAVAGGTETGKRFEGRGAVALTSTRDKIRRGGFIPDEAIKDMDLDGVHAGIMYPTVGLSIYRIQDDALVMTLFKAYNEWLAEFCGAFPDRLLGIGCVILDDVVLAVQELERCARMGLRGIMISCYPFREQHYGLPQYEPFWTAAERLGMPVSLHVATMRPAPEIDMAWAFNEKQLVRRAHYANQDHWMRMSIADMIFGGVFERYPGLRVGAVEQETSWVPYFLYRMDHFYTERAQRPHWKTLGMLPSEYFRQNLYVCFQEDPLGIQLREHIGVDNMAWGSDYPHPESTFPKTQEILEHILTGCTDEEKVKIAGGNAARIYGLNGTK